MSNVPSFSSPLDYLGVLLLLFGAFLVLAGLQVVQVERISVTPGRKTWGFGLFLCIVGIVFLIPQITSFESAVSSIPVNLPTTNENISSVDSQNEALIQQDGDYFVRPFRVKLEKCRLLDCDIKLVFRVWDASGSIVFNNEQTFFDWQVQDYRDTDFSMSTAGVRFYEGESVEYELECVDEDGVSQRSVRRAVEGNTSRGEYYVWSTCEVGTFAASVGVSISPLSKPLYLAQPFEVKVDSCSLSGCEDVVLYLRVWGHEETDSIEAKETFTDFTDPGDRRDAEFEGKALVNFPAGSNANFQLYCEGADGNNHPGDSVSLPHGNYEEWLSCSTGLITVSVGIEVTN